MKFATAMLRDLVETPLDAQGIGDLLTMAGFELEEIDGDDLDIKVCSNRGDGLSMLGLAREIIAKDPQARPTDLYHRAANGFAEVALGESDAPAVRVESDNCRRFTVVRIDGIRPQSSPAWLVERLERAGMRSLGLVVDLTNYVMLELGAPTHAFDAQKLAGGTLVVREAREGESVTTLDGVEHPEIAGITMVCDAERPQSVAGVMGGHDAEYSDATTTLLLEAGNWEPIPIRRGRKRLGLGTEASYRFERDVDPNLTVVAIRRFVELLRRERPDVRVSAPFDFQRETRTRTPISLSVARAARRLGMPVTADEATSYLRKLGMTVEGEGDRVQVTPPTWRPDIRREDDLVEEIGRVHGYDKIPETPLQGTVLGGGLQGRYLRDARLRDAARRAGFTQIVSHSLRGPSPLDATPLETRVAPRVTPNPESSLLRDDLLANLADAAVRNLSHTRDLMLFELGRVFTAEGEHTALGLLATGRLLAEDRKGEAAPNVDFYAMKGWVDAIARGAGTQVEVALPETPDARFHPTRQAAILSRDGECGLFGELHPDILRELDLPAGTVAATLRPDGLMETPVALRHVARTPAIRRDMAILAPKDVPYADLERVIRENAGDDLEKVWVFDLYEGPGIPEGHRSTGVGMVFRKAEGTYTDEEANAIRDRVVAALASVGATTR